MSDAILHQPDPEQPRDFTLPDHVLETASHCAHCDRPIAKATFRELGKWEPDWDPADDPSMWRHVGTGYAACRLGTTWATPAPAAPAVIDAAHLAHQREWSERTFGPGQRTLGVLDHIGKELDEVRADPTDLSEWVDVIILAFDGAWRHGWEPQQIIDAIKAKQAKNEARTWPDWRTMSADQAIEHDRSGE